MIEIILASQLLLSTVVLIGYAAYLAYLLPKAVHLLHLDLQVASKLTYSAFKVPPDIPKEMQKSEILLPISDLAESGEITEKDWIAMLEELHAKEAGTKSTTG